MAHANLNIEKEACRLSGIERARLVIKDACQKSRGDKRGFLTPGEIRALKDMPDPQVKKEFNRFWGIYKDAALSVAEMTELTLRLQYSFEQLKKAHVLLNLTPVVQRLLTVIDRNIANHAQRSEAVKLVGLIQVVGKDACHHTAFKNSLHFIAEVVPSIAADARSFIEGIETMENVNKAMGCNIYAHKGYFERCRVYVSEIKIHIEEHNGIVRKFGAGMKCLDPYLIPAVDGKKTASINEKGRS